MLMVVSFPSCDSLGGEVLTVCLAFGLFARALPKTEEFGKLHEFVAGLELADSIGADAHKILNVVRKSWGEPLGIC